MTHNWAGNLAYGATRLHTPSTVDEVRMLVAGATRIRALGTRHSFNTIADTRHELLSTERLDAPARIDEASRTATVGAGTRYGVLARQLDDAGWALAAMASLPHISVGGAIATGTHGSGDRSGSLATAVSALELVTASGDLVTLRRGDPDFAGAVVSLGALGVVTAVTLDIEPAYDVEQHVYERMPWAALTTHLDEITGAAHSVSLFTTWSDPDTIDQLWLKRRGDRDAPLPAELFGALPATEQRHPLPGVPAQNCTPQLGVPGRWLDRLPHFRLEFTPSNGEELQSEYLVPREHAVAALSAVRALSPRIAPLLFVSEVRTIAADELWLSEAHGGDMVGLHFTWKPRQREVEALLPTLEAALAPFGARPHWGKLFAAGDLSSLYPRASDFAKLRARLDPERKFGNEFLERHLPG
ncbi:xylitol oxidase [Homoserinimonas aerilata]|uniref:Xylitol oxidase n=1 Tax=Homoserinimonas aerilata TaxID=1162970 RepID=A0A542YL40_9MICO|nr:FAD-binding protein [Homoserinimonas aerilata]TQL48805.1 xylitol oxidase [Homoserinimonas aerilata]